MENQSYGRGGYNQRNNFTPRNFDNSRQPSDMHSLRDINTRLRNGGTSNNRPYHEYRKPNQNQYHYNRIQQLCEVVKTYSQAIACMKDAKENKLYNEMCTTLEKANLKVNEELDKINFKRTFHNDQNRTTDEHGEFDEQSQMSTVEDEEN